MVASLVNAGMLVDRDRLYRKVGFRIVPLLFMGYVVANLDRNNVAFAKLEFLPALGFSDSIFGLGAGLFYLGYVACEIPSNLLMVRIGIRPTFVRIMALWFVCCLGLALITQPWHYYVSRALLGGAEAGYFPGVLLYLSRWAPRARRARFTALFMSAIPISGMVGAPAAGALMHVLDGLWGLSGWRWLFIMESLPAALLAIIFYRSLLDTTGEAPWLNDAERQVIASDLAEDDAPTTGTADWRRDPPLSAFSALRSLKAYLLGFQAFALLSGLNGLNLWGPSVLKASGISDVLHIGLWASLPQMAGIVALIGAAELSDRRSERRYHTVVPSIAAAVGWLLLPWFHHQPLAVVLLLTLIAIGVFGATGPFWAIPSQYIRGPSAPAGIALITTMGALGAMISPVIVGWLTDKTGSLGAGLYFYTAISFAGAASLLAATRRSAR